MKEFLRGMDLSSLPEMLDKGFHYYDFAGRPKDPLLLAKENGVNAVRLRVWNEPWRVPESHGYCDKEQTVAFARRIKEMGFLLFLDFHYSDWWADPGQQRKPEAWVGLDFPHLCQAVYDYTREVLQALREADAYPEMVQIGNEIRSGMIFPEGAVQNWPFLSKLLNQGIRAVRDMEKGIHTEVVLHLDQGGRQSYYREWFDQALAHGVTDFDMIGLSYYPFWHGTYYELKNTMEYVAGRYGKPLVVAETAYAFRSSEQGFINRQQEEIAGFPAGIRQQREVLELVMSITAHIENGMGRGVFYWEPMMIPGHGNGGWADQMGLIDENGHCLEGLKAFWPSAYEEPQRIVKLYYRQKLLQVLGGPSVLPRTVRCLRRDGKLEVRPVSFPEPVPSRAGTYLFAGTVEGCSLPVKLLLQVVDELPVLENLAVNGDFRNGMEGWNFRCSDERVESGIRLEEDASSGQTEMYFQFDAPLNFEARLSQEIPVEAGVYEACLDYRGDNTTGVAVSLQLRGREEQAELPIYPADEGWEHYCTQIHCSQAQTIAWELVISGPPICGRVKGIGFYRQA